jgi:ankyrin repeat protein
MELHTAVRRDDWKSFLRLLAAGANVADVDRSDGNTLLHVLAGREEPLGGKRLFGKSNNQYCIEIAARVRQHGTTVEKLAFAVNSHGDTALHRAIWHDNWAFAIQLAKYVSYWSRENLRLNRLGLNEREWALLLYGLKARQEEIEQFSSFPDMRRSHRGHGRPASSL